jgi:hypothetical protein
LPGKKESLAGNVGSWRIGGTASVNLWMCREESNAALLTTLEPLGVLLEGAFLRLDEAVRFPPQRLAALIAS